MCSQQIDPRASCGALVRSWTAKSQLVQVQVTLKCLGFEKSRETRLRCCRWPTFTKRSWYREGDLPSTTISGLRMLSRDSLSCVRTINNLQDARLSTVSPEPKGAAPFGHLRLVIPQPPLSHVFRLIQIRRKLNIFDIVIDLNKVFPSSIRC
jgi:hypothetical protein